MTSLRDRLRTLFGTRLTADSAHDLAHLDRVWANADLIASNEHDVSKRVLLAAASLHDLVNLPKDAPNRAQASRLASKAAGPILADLGYDKDETADVQHAIEAHSFSAGIAPRTSEARILRDADRLDALGAIGIARCFAVSGALSRALYDPDDPFAVARTPDDREYALDHWPLKLLELESGMLTETGRKLARERIETMRSFALALAREINHPAEGWAVP